MSTLNKTEFGKQRNLLSFSLLIFHHCFDDLQTENEVFNRRFHFGGDH